MRASSSSSCNSTGLTKRYETICKKAYELSILCGIEVCVIHYGADGELKTWPEEREKVKDMALRYKEAKKRKKSFNLHEFIDQEKKDESEKKKKKQKKNVRSDPIFDHYSSHQLSQLIQSLEQTLSKLQERIRVVESQKRKNTNLVHHEYDLQTQPLNYSLSTFSELPLSNQFYQNHCLMQQDQLYGFDKNIMSMMSEFTNSNVYDAVNNYYLMQQHMCMMSEFTNSNNIQQHHALSNTVPLELSQQNPNYGDFNNSTFLLW